METKKVDPVAQFFRLAYRDESDGVWIYSGKALRRLIGILGMFLPLFLWFFLFLHIGQREELESLSHYYYTRVDAIFIITISLMAIFLILYKSYDTIDFILSLIAGIGALVLVLFPTSPIISHYPDPTHVYSNTVLWSNPGRDWIHFIAAGVFIVSLACMSIFLFTKSDNPQRSWSSMKSWRNRLYRFCGVGMIGAVIIIGLGWMGYIPEYEERNMTFWMEFIAVELFGLSWLVKGETLLRDKKSSAMS